jgi:hypothetical protein
MNLYINDMSYQPQVVKANPHHLINVFIDVSDRAKSFLFEKIVMPNDYKIRDIIQNFSFVTYQGTAHYRDVTNERFKSLLANQLVKMSADNLDESIQYVYYNQTESYYFKKAYNRNVPVVSFRTLEEFDNPTLDIVNKYLDDAEQEKINNNVIRNVSNKAHFIHHQEYFNEQAYKNANQNGKWNAKQKPLPRVEATATYLTDFKFTEQWAKGNETFRVKLANEAGTYIAEMNGWEYKSRLTNRNQRSIFKALNQSVYLSIDTMHGTFELHDRNGRHLGEYNFSGEQLEDSQHKHNIYV